MNRAVLWLVGGLVGFVLLVIAIAPELLGDLGFASGAVAFTLAAVVPGLLVMALFASSRRGRRRRHAERGARDRDLPERGRRDQGPQGRSAPSPRDHTTDPGA